jgi:hypothetical protein
MKRVGSVLMDLGAGIGVIAGIGIGGGFHLAFPWLVNVALGKLTLAASGGVMAAGAVVRRQNEPARATRVERWTSSSSPEPRMHNRIEIHFEAIALEDQGVRGAPDGSRRLDRNTLQHVRVESGRN